MEKNSELPIENKSRKYKGRVVFQGNRVVNQNWEIAVFQDMGNSPATMDASKACDCYGCIPDHNVQCADAEQASGVGLLFVPSVNVKCLVIDFVTVLSSM